MRAFVCTNEPGDFTMSARRPARVRLAENMDMLVAAVNVVETESAFVPKRTRVYGGPQKPPVAVAVTEHKNERNFTAADFIGAPEMVMPIPIRTSAVGVVNYLAPPQKQQTEAQFMNEMHNKVVLLTDCNFALRTTLLRTQTANQFLKHKVQKLSEENKLLKQQNSNNSLNESVDHNTNK